MKGRKFNSRWQNIACTDEFTKPNVTAQCDERKCKCKNGDVVWMWIIKIQCKQMSMWKSPAISIKDVITVIIHSHKKKYKLLLL